MNVEVTSNAEIISKQLLAIYRQILDKTSLVREHFQVNSEASEVSRDNLLAYLALRENDLQELQNNLAEEGLSSLGRLEANVVTHLEKVLGHLGVNEEYLKEIHRPSSTDAFLLSQVRNERVLGKTTHDRHTNIMVTLDVSMLEKSEIIEKLLLNGMDLARINCAHDSQTEWKLLIDTLRQSEVKLHNQGLYNLDSCKIYMDLGGPKIRIGQFKKEIRPLKISAAKDIFGNKTSIVEGYIDLKAEYTDKMESLTDSCTFVIAVEGKTKFTSIKIGEELSFRDTRDKKRNFRVLEILSPTKIRVSTESTCYIGNQSKIAAKSGEVFKVRDLMPRPVQIQVQKEDRLYIYRDHSRLGHNASDKGPAGVAAMLPEALTKVQMGDQVFIDDGKIGGNVINLTEEYVELEIVKPAINKAKIKEEKGLNFPETSIDLPALTDQDLEDLKFVVQYADTVGLSFVHTPQDLVDLRKALVELGRPDIAVVAKIETSDAIQNLARIIVEGLNFHAFGVMIARGDLAVEVGFENMSIVQEDILCMCDAAHIPVIWATQVLENLAKLGVPARAEITDAAMGHRAECVMLNKGPHIVDAVQVLSKLLTTEARHHVKKRQVFTEFTMQQGLF